MNIKLYAGSHKYREQEFEAEFDRKPERGDYRLLVWDEDNETIKYISPFPFDNLDGIFEEQHTKILNLQATNNNYRIDKIQFVTDCGFEHRRIVLQSTNSWRNARKIITSNSIF